MGRKEIRERQLKKGADFSTRFICRFSREWGQAVQRVKSGGARLDAIMIAKK